MKTYRPANIRQDDLIRSALYAKLESVEKDIIWYQKMTRFQDSEGFYAKMLCSLEADRYALNCLLDRPYKAPYIPDHSDRFLYL